MEATTYVWLSDIADTRRIESRLEGPKRDQPVLDIGPVRVGTLPKDPAVQIELFARVRDAADALIERIGYRAEQVRHAGDWGGDAA